MLLLAAHEGRSCRGMVVAHNIFLVSQCFFLPEYFELALLILSLDHGDHLGHVCLF